MKKILFILLCLLVINSSFSQNTSEERDLSITKDKIDSIAVLVPKLNEYTNIQIDVSKVSLSDFLIGLAYNNNINIAVDPSLKTKFLINNFPNAPIKDILLYLCDSYNLDLKIIGEIIEVFTYSPPKKAAHKNKVLYLFNEDQISIDVENIPLGALLKEISSKTPLNLFFKPNIENLPISFFSKSLNTEYAIKALAETNSLNINSLGNNMFSFEVKTKELSDDGFKYLNSNDHGLKVIDQNKKLVSVKGEDIDIARLIYKIATTFNLNWYVSEPLGNMGKVTLKFDQIHVNSLLDYLFNNQDYTENAKSFKRTIDEYFIGSKNSFSTKTARRIQLKNRTIEMLEDKSVNTSGQLQEFNLNNFTNPFNQGLNNELAVPSNTNQKKETNNKSIIEYLIPKIISNDLHIKVDQELNSIYVLGPDNKVKQLEDFIQKIDVSVPVILIEVMLIEVNESSETETGISWGIGSDPTTTEGNMFPNIDTQIAPKEVNKIIGGFSALKSLNLGKLNPNFYLSIKALESSGKIRILSSPKMATMNGHRAVFTNKEISYYAYTSQNFYGLQNPQTSEIRNYIPISAGLTLSVKPYVNGNNEVTLDIFVQQSTFNNNRIAEDAPPGIESREFSSIVKMKNKDIAILGGLEQNIKNDSGSGVPFLARVPIIKWLFSKRVRNVSKKKLTVLIQPTLIQ